MSEHRWKALGNLFLALGVGSLVAMEMLIFMQEFDKVTAMGISAIAFYVWGQFCRATP